MSNSAKTSPLHDPKVEAVLDRLYREANRQFAQLLMYYLPQLPRFLMGKGFQWHLDNTDFYQDKYIPIDRDQGAFLYLMARSLQAKTIVEFGTSFGISTLYLAAAVRDNGGGLVIGTECVSEKVQQAQTNLTEAGLAAYVDIRVGDALETLKTLNQPIDLVLMDGFPTLAIEVLKLVDPFLRVGGTIVSDNVNTFKEALKPYVEFLQNPDSGYRSTTLALKGGTEVSVKVCARS